MTAVIMVITSCKTHLITSVLAKLDTTNYLLIDEVGRDSVRFRIVPWSKNFFTEKQSPGGITFHSSLLLGILFTLRDSVHDMITTATQWRHLLAATDSSGQNNNKMKQNRCSFDFWKHENGFPLLTGICLVNQTMPTLVVLFTNKVSWGEIICPHK